MREILFRGKRADGKWAVGSLLKVTFDGITYNLIFADNFLFVFGQATAMEHAAVIPETVGQFTGLTDKNGKKVFEGDIVEGRCHSRWRQDMQRCEVAYGRDGFECRHHIGGIDTDYYTYRVLFSKDVVVIGNIHDNPELLEVEDDK